MTDQTIVARTRAADPYGYEGWGEKFKRKFNENPWVPLGCLATVGALVMSAVKMRSGQSKQMNYWMRARVGLQGVTLVALVAGTMALQKKEKEAHAAQELTPEQIKQKEKEEFEERMRNAEAAYEQEKAFAEGAAVRKAKAAAAAPSALVGVATPVEKSPTQSSTSGKSWWKIW